MSLTELKYMIREEVNSFKLERATAALSEPEVYDMKHPFKEQRSQSAYVTRELPNAVNLSKNKNKVILGAKSGLPPTRAVSEMQSRDKKSRIKPPILPPPKAFYKPSTQSLSSRSSSYSSCSTCTTTSTTNTSTTSSLYPLVYKTAFQSTPEKLTIESEPEMSRHTISNSSGHHISGSSHHDTPV